MSAIRQDAWTEQDDHLLAEVTLRHIKDGGTQLSAFAEVGQRIGRTQAACGFRWNSYLRKVYGHDVRQAKLQRQQIQSDRRKVTLKRTVSEHLLNDGLSFTDIANAMQQWLAKWRELQIELTQRNAELSKLRKENEDYRALLQIIDRARNMTV